MGVFQYLNQSMRGFANPLAWIDNADQVTRRSHFERLYDFYSGEEGAIKEHVQKAMKEGKTFKTETLQKMFFPYLNIVRRIINRLCVAYKLSPERYILVPKRIEGDVQVPDAKMEKSHLNYQKMLSASNINSQAKVWHRYAKAFDTAHVMPIVRNGKMDFDVFAPHQIDVIARADDYLEPSEVAYSTVGGDGKERQYYWSVEEHWVYDEDGKPIEGENPWGGVNRYGVLPVIPLRLRETASYWGEGDTQLVDINEKIDILLASTYYNAIMQAHGQLVLINFDQEGEIAIGPDKILQAKNVLKSDVVPDAKYIHPDPAIEECLRKIDWMTKTAAMLRGLPASSVSIEEKAQSGAAKAIDNWELLEIREDDVEWLRPFEKRLFDVSRAVWNFHNPSERIDDNAVFGIDFIEPKQPMTEDEMWKSKRNRLQFGLWTPVDDMVDEDEGITRELAKQMVKENLMLRNELLSFGGGNEAQMGARPGEPEEGEDSADN